MDWKTAFESDPRFGGIYQKVARPAWPTRVAVLSGLLVILLPLLLILLAGLMVGTLVYVLGSLVARAGEVISGPTGGRDAATSGPYAADDVRENVRVIHR